MLRPVIGYIEFQITGTWTSMRQCWRRWRRDLEITLIPRITSTPKMVKWLSPLNFPLWILHLFDLEVSVLSLLRLQFPKFLGRLFNKEHLNFKNIINSLHQQLMVSQKNILITLNIFSGVHWSREVVFQRFPYERKSNWDDKEWRVCFINLFGAATRLLSVEFISHSIYLFCWSLLPTTDPYSSSQ